MRRYDVIKLIPEVPKAHPVFDDDAEEQSREVMCEVRSIGQNAYYQAYKSGLNLSYVFILSQPEEYKNEKIVVYKNDRYRVVRTYINAGDAVEITVEPDLGNDGGM